MPLLSVRNLAPDVRLGIWKIEETVENFLSSSPQLIAVYRQEIAAYKSHTRQLEELAVYSLLWKMAGSPLTITHNAVGKPFVNGWHISISHTKGYAAVIISPTVEVAIDIEYRSNRVNRVANRFIRSDEEAPDIIGQLINWCAKETLYKYCSTQNLQYFEMKVASSDHPPLVSYVDNLRAATRHEFAYEVTEDYVMTYIVGEKE